MSKHDLPVGSAAYWNTNRHMMQSGYSLYKVITPMGESPLMPGMRVWLKGDRGAWTKDKHAIYVRVIE